MPIDKTVAYLPYDDYAQSANTLFHFMKKSDYLKAILRKHAIIPRYCLETIDYLNIHNGNRLFTEAAILQKCFCDIPFHKLADSFAVNGVGEAFDSLSSEEKAELEKNNTHFDYYGKYAIAFSKSWGEANGLQPVHYLNRDSQYTKGFSSLFEKILEDEDIPEQYSDDVLNRLSYIKPLRGIMKRKVTRKGANDIDVEIYKNFHDEREWRYVPPTETINSLGMQNIIANPNKLPLKDKISDGLQAEKYKKLRLNFAYDDIRYIIVPNVYARIEIIDTIMNMSEACFENKDEILTQKYILISKILVLEEIRKD